MCTLCFILFIAAATYPVLVSSREETLPPPPPFRMHPIIGRTTSSASFQSIGHIRRACFASHFPFYGTDRTGGAPSRGFIESYAFKSNAKLNLSIQPTQMYHQFQRCTNFHSSATMLMMSKRKKNGGKSKRSKLVQSGGGGGPSSTKTLDHESTLEQESDQRTLSDLFDDENPDTEGRAVPSTQYATEYHAPVMPTECVQAMLKQGQWAELLNAKKIRWRKRRRIIEAKRKRLGYYDDDKDVYDDDDEEYSTDEAMEQENEHESSGLMHDLSGVSPQSSHNTSKPRLFIDGTLGGGGHSQAILEQLSSGDILIGCDVDPEALSTASNRLRKYLATRAYILDGGSFHAEDELECQWEEGRPMFIPVQSNFRNLISVLSKVRHPITGRLLLGNRDTESFENYNDTSERGFAFMKDGPLDMRMSGRSQISSTTTIRSSLTAADICNEFDEPTIISILRTFGDEPRAKRIASAIVASRPLYSTTDLVHAINSVTPTFARQKRAGLIATCARVFQALRIVVNEEDEALRDVLEKVAPWVLCRSGGMMNVENSEEVDAGVLAVLSYHSMEDKMAKRVMRDGSVDFLKNGSHGGALDRDIFGNVIDKNSGGLIDMGDRLPFEPLGKPQKATDEEIAVNTRARSATLRVGIRN
ncbi:hypothetical protein HJC23_010945 [Cyclotella cryptica]|uniref:Uncharacterized protein n=1 Tax=Cyclotella cryptica TaxID=29204 RepID=A0ABD3Q9L5_9STRA